MLSLGEAKKLAFIACMSELEFNLPTNPEKWAVYYGLMCEERLWCAVGQCRTWVDPADDLEDYEFEQYASCILNRETAQVYNMVTRKEEPLPGSLWQE